MKYVASTPTIFHINNYITFLSHKYFHLKISEVTDISFSNIYDVSLLAFKRALHVYHIIASCEIWVFHWFRFLKIIS